jgi:hypothetical protein
MTASSQPNPHEFSEANNAVSTCTSHHDAGTYGQDQWHRALTVPSYSARWSNNFFNHIKTAMANWFENNPTKSVISYTLMVAAATWAVSTYVLQDNPLNILRSQMEEQKTIAEKYRSKVELLQRDLDVLRSENAEYRQWLSQTKDAIPNIAPRIVELKQQVSELKAAISSNAPLTVTARRQGTALRGTAYIDKATGLVFTVLQINPDGTATVRVKLPEEETTFEERGVKPGKQWPFTFKETKLNLTVTSIYFIADVVDLEIAGVK